MNNKRGSLARGYEPTTKILHATSTYIASAYSYHFRFFFSLSVTINDEKIFEKREILSRSLDKSRFEIQGQIYVLIFLFTRIFLFKSNSSFSFDLEFTANETSVPEPTVTVDEPPPSPPAEVEVQPPPTDVLQENPSTTVCQSLFEQTKIDSKNLVENSCNLFIRSCCR